MFDVFVSTSKNGDLVFTTSGIITLVAVLLLILVATSLFPKKGTAIKLGAKQLTFCGIAMALGLVTSFLEIYSFPFGGSVTLFSMLFITLIGYFYGAKVSIPVAIAYGVLQLIIKPYIYHPIQVLFDYPLAFGALGVSCFFANKKNGLIKGYLVAIIGRWIFSSVSGYVFFAEYAWSGWNPLAYALVYNGAYIFAEGIITIIILCLPAVSRGIAQVKKMAVQN